MTAPQDDTGPAGTPPPEAPVEPKENTLLHWIVFVAMMSAIIGAGYLFVP